MGDGEPQPLEGDAFGRALLAHLDGDIPAHYVVERDDGWLSVLDAATYFGAIDAWSPTEGQAIEHAGSRVLDVGAGAGRVALHLQERGIDVTALDVSPGAIDVCRRRGVRTTFLGTVFDLAAEDVRPFDTIVYFGNNLGLLESPEQVPRLLGALRRLSRPGARILGTTIDPYDTTDPDHLAYHEHNRRLGRMAGQVPIRIRYERLATPWQSLLWTSLDELRRLAEPEGWRLARHWVEGPTFSVMLELD